MDYERKPYDYHWDMLKKEENLYFIFNISGTLHDLWKVEQRLAFFKFKDWSKASGTVAAHEHGCLSPTPPACHGGATGCSVATPVGSFFGFSNSSARRGVSSGAGKLYTDVISKVLS